MTEFRIVTVDGDDYLADLWGTGTSLQHNRHNTKEIDLGPAKGVTYIESISINHTRIENLDLSPLAGLPYLESVDLSYNHLASIDLAPLGKCPKLKTLNLSWNEMNRISLSPVRKCHFLESINLSSIQLLTLNLTPLSSCRNLVGLDISDNFLKDLDLSPLETCGRLERMKCEKNDLVSLDLSPIITLPRLKTISCDPHTSLKPSTAYWNARVKKDRIEKDVRIVSFELLVKAAPTAQQIEHDSRPLSELLKEGEGQTLEYKSSFRLDVASKRINESLEHAVLRTISGFMNSQGGVLLIGVQNNGTTCGIGDELQKVKGKSFDGYELVLRNSIERSLGVKNENLVDVCFEPWGDQFICRVNVLRSVDGPVFLKRAKGDEEFLERIGNSTKKLTLPDSFAYIRKNWPEQFIVQSEQKQNNS